MENQW